MAIKHARGIDAILALLREDGAAWTPEEIADWLSRNVGFGPLLSAATCKTHLYSLSGLGVVEIVREPNKDSRFRYITPAPGDRRGQGIGVPEEGS